MRSFGCNVTILFFKIAIVCFLRKKMEAFNYCIFFMTILGVILMEPVNYLSRLKKKLKLLNSFFFFFYFVFLEDSSQRNVFITSIKKFLKYSPSKTEFSIIWMYNDIWFLFNFKNSKNYLDHLISTVTFEEQFHEILSEIISGHFL